LTRIQKLFDLNPDIIKTNFLGKLKKIWVTTVAASANKICLRFDLVTYFFYPSPPMFKLNPDIIKTNILSKFEKDLIKIVAALVLISFFLILT